MHIARVRSVAKPSGSPFKPIVGGVLGDFKAPAEAAGKKSDAKLPDAAGLKTAPRHPIRKF